MFIENKLFWPVMNASDFLYLNVHLNPTRRKHIDYANDAFHRCV